MKRMTMKPINAIAMRFLWPTASKNLCFIYGIEFWHDQQLILRTAQHTNVLGNNNNNNKSEAQIAAVQIIMHSRKLLMIQS